MSLSRRQFVQYLSIAPLLTSAMPVVSQQTNSRADRIAQIIREYSEQGSHRTGTDVDTASAHWMLARLQESGVEALLDSVELDRIEVINASFAFPNHQLECEPLYDCLYTDAEGVTGTLGPLGSDADIGVIMLPPSTVSPRHTQLQEARLNSSHRGIVIVSDLGYPAEGIATINAEDFRAPFGPPVVQIANASWEALQQAMSQRQPATIVARCERVAVTAFNVRGKINGSSPALPPLVIMTPRSGWWQCASERGGGIALFLELARDFSLHPPQRDVIFTANTGHELSHLGLDQYLHNNPTLVRDAAMWIHLGANFAARGSSVRLQYSEESFRALTFKHLAPLNLQPGIETPMNSRPLGEARNVYDGGGNFISLLGSNPLFHHPQDVWPDAVDMDTTTAWVEAFSALVMELGGA